jgi:REP element-mobilizing transposase RayT
MPREDRKEWPGRPPRLGRLSDNVRPFYFVTFNTYKRQSLLARAEVHAAFCTFSIKAQERNVAVGRYVIMPDHVHLFAAFPIDGIALPSWVQSLRQRDWEEIAPTRNSQATLARRLFRPSVAQP